MCSERDSPLKRLYRWTHAKLTCLAGSGQLVWAADCELSLALVHARRPAWPGETSRHPRQYLGSPRRAKRGRPITHEWIDPWTLLLPGQHRWAQAGATGEPREFRLARSRQDKRLERAIPLTTHLWVNRYIYLDCFTVPTVSQYQSSARILISVANGISAFNIVLVINTWPLLSKACIRLVP